MKISKFFCMLIAGLAIIGFTTIGIASQEETHSESKEVTKAEATVEAKGAAKADSDAEFKAESDEKEAKAEEKE